MKSTNGDYAPREKIRAWYEIYVEKWGVRLNLYGSEVNILRAPLLSLFLIEMCILGLRENSGAGGIRHVSLSSGQA